VNINSLFSKGVEPILERLSVEPAHENNLGGRFRCSLRTPLQSDAFELTSSHRTASQHPILKVLLRVGGYRLLKGRSYSRCS
jgi:hypothetical protein